MNKIMKTLMITMLIMLIMSNIIKMMTNKNKLSMNTKSIECGFNNINNKNIPISMNFMIIMILFILLDLEIVIMLPFLMSYKMMNNLLTMFILLMIITLMYEIKNNNINWNK